MQVESVEGFSKRVTYNLSKTYSNQLSSGEGYLQLNPVIALTITDFKMFKKTKEFISRFSFIEEKKKFIYRDDERKIILRQIQRRFGKIDEETMALIEELSAENLELLAEVIFDFNESQDLLNYLQNH